MHPWLNKKDVCWLEGWGCICVIVGFLFAVSFLNKFYFQFFSSCFRLQTYFNQTLHTVRRILFPNSLGNNWMQNIWNTSFGCITWNTSIVLRHSVDLLPGQTTSAGGSLLKPLQCANNLCLLCWSGTYFWWFGYFFFIDILCPWSQKPINIRCIVLFEFLPFFNFPLSRFKHC